MSDIIFEFENIIAEENQREIKNTLYGNNFPWYYNNDPTFANQISKRGTTFSSQIYGEQCNSPFTNLFTPIAQSCCNKLKVTDSKIFNIRSFLHIKNPKFLFNRRDTLHIDNQFPHVVIIYYVNDADGPTEIVNDKKKIIKKIIPKQGKCVCFDGKLYHRSTHPKYHNRCIINFNLTLN